MENISVSVRVPALAGTYDFIVPQNMCVRDAQQLMINILVSEYGISEGTAGTILFDLDSGLALRQECSLEQMGVSDGTILMLM